MGYGVGKDFISWECVMRISGSRERYEQWHGDADAGLSSNNQTMDFG